MKTLLIFVLALLPIFGFGQNKPKAKPAKAKTTKAPQKPLSKEKEGHGNFAVDEEVEEAKFDGTEEELVNFFMNNITFSDSAIAMQIEGNVTLQFMVSETGTPQEVKVVKGVGYGIDQEMEKLAPQLKYKPAKIAGVPIKMEQLITIPIRAYKKQ